MKISKILLVSAVSLLFAGCNSTESVPQTAVSTTTTYAELTQTITTIQEIQTNSTTAALITTDKTTTSTTKSAADVSTELTTTAVSTSITKETVASTTTAVTTDATTATYEGTTNHQENVVSSEETAETSEIIPESAETTASIEESDKNGFTVFKDNKTKNDFVILNLTAEKVYWSESEDYSISTGETVDIAVPAVFAEWFTDTDEVMLYIGEHFQKIPVMDCGDMTVKGITYTDYWSMDNICLINDGIVHFGEYTDEMKNAFKRIDDGYFIEEANYYYPDFPLEEGMTVDNLDLYFETMKADKDVLYEKIANNPDTDYDIAGFWGQIDGIRFRAKINYIY